MSGCNRGVGPRGHERSQLWLPAGAATVVGMSPGQSWIVVAAVAAGGVLFFAAGLAANRLLRPSAPTREKLATYESGVDPVGRGWSQTQVRYYLYAFLYVIFAVDAVYLFPWATVVKPFGWATVAEMGVFLGVLAIGLLHAWRRGALRWQ
jgi:NADH-quinone oxidoreductase subunit A